MNVYDTFVVAGPQNYENSNTISILQREIVKIIPFIPENTSEYVFRERFNGNVLAIGRLVFYKGFEYLMRAVKESGYSLKIIGRVYCLTICPSFKLMILSFSAMLMTNRKMI